MVACFFTGLAQEDTTFHLAQSYDEPVTDFAVDNLGNLYIINSRGQLKKTGPAGDSLAVFNDLKRYGKLYSIDVSNPLQVLLYYKDFGTVVILDRFLSVRATLDLRKLNLFQVKAIGLAYDNNLWVFDELESKLKRVGLDGRVIDQSADFRTIFDNVPSPQYVVDENKLVYLYDSLQGVYLFDYYTAYKNHIPLTGWSGFTVINNTLYGRDGQYLYRYQPGTLQLESFPLPAFMQAAKKILVTPTHLYLLRADRLERYSYR